jgi:xanthine dehydrogenase accessory factor
MTGHTWDTPESALPARIREVLAQGREAVLVTVADVSGNTYRKPGAKMLVPRDGAGTGIVTPGCLDEEIADSCSTVLDAGTPRLERFDLTADDDVWGLGVGCNGVTTLLFEPVTERHRPVVEAAASRTPVVSLVALPTEGIDGVPCRTHYTAADGFDAGTPGWLTAAFEDSIDEFERTGGATLRTVETGGTPVDVFVEGIRPPPTLVVVGSGNDVRPVVGVANRVGFHTVVVGFRGGKATPARFPDADRVVSTAPADVADALDIDEETLAVVMTHNFVDDRLAVAELLGTPTPYIGLMGPTSRVDKIREGLEADAAVTDGWEQRMYSPVGLDLGGGSPNQIALSIVSEALAVHNNRDGHHLREKRGGIHDAPTE